MRWHRDTTISRCRHCKAQNEHSSKAERVLCHLCGQIYVYALTFTPS